MSWNQVVERTCRAEAPPDRPGGLALLNPHLLELHARNIVLQRQACNDLAIGARAGTVHKTSSSIARSGDGKPRSSIEVLPKVMRSSQGSGRLPE